MYIYICKDFINTYRRGLICRQSESNLDSLLTGKCPFYRSKIFLGAKIPIPFPKNGEHYLKVGKKTVNINYEPQPNQPPSISSICICTIIWRYIVPRNSAGCSSTGKNRHNSVNAYRVRGHIESFASIHWNEEENRAS